MIFYPQGRLGRSLLLVWLAACLSVLVFAFIQREVADTDIGFAWFMIYLTFPAGLGLASLMGLIFGGLYQVLGIVVPGGFVFNFTSWLLFVAVGYFQWFVVVPWVYSKLSKSSNKKPQPTAKRVG